MNLLNLINNLGRAELDEVVFQVQKINPDATPESVVSNLKVMEDDGLVQVEVIVSLTDGGKGCL